MPPFFFFLEDLKEEAKLPLSETDRKFIFIWQEITSAEDYLFPVWDSQELAEFIYRDIYLMSDAYDVLLLCLNDLKTFSEFFLN